MSNTHIDLFMEVLFNLGNQVQILTTMSFLSFRQDRLRQRPFRPVRHGSDRVRQHADVAGRLYQDDGEGEGCRCATHDERIQGM